ncbi:MAG: hypothetical protein D5R97_05650 [Candidatus Syntrophonatronum acetioxidans]|uniref:Uncharacterized protein n=1 Tax=Candidatus Syntrophonatronum acetioxidans TaxID=1795816 RepID=A0A424YE59_9FIRM|nr:MAG: hypothetical protein D5R97_05650 [Candidatus Syntrophonatronum acetioxidans]
METPLIYNSIKSITSSEFMIKIKDPDKNRLGEIEHLQTGQVFTIKDFGQMALIIQNMLMQYDYPKADTQIRSWESKNNKFTNNKGTNKERSTSKKFLNEKENAKSDFTHGPNFYLRIYYRQNATWQGSIQWVEEKSTIFFRSYLEMVLLIQEALEKTQSKQE